MNKYLFYPGCSMQRSARPYLDSLLAIREDIDITLEEVRDWNCCGATEYVSVHNLAALALVGRNLALATQQVNGTRTMVAACSACYLNLSKTDFTMGDDIRVDQSVNDALSMADLHYKPGTLDIRHILDVVFNDVGLEAIKAKVKKPLKGLRVAPYYGCMIVRPDHKHQYDAHEYPMALDHLLSALGAEVIDFPMKTHCCSGHMTQISPPVAYELIRRLIYAADNYKADVIATLCPMCQLNLDAYQGDMNDHFHTNYHVPVVYFTQLMGLAFGHAPEELGLGKEFVDPSEALAKIGIDLPREEVEEVRPSSRKKPKEEGLPMPKMQKSGEEVAE